jgi:hypothetical protein
MALFVAPKAFAVSFAGEEIPANRPEAAESLDQELLLLSEAKSRVFLTLRRAGRYLPIIDHALSQAKAPPDFRYLPMALASLNPALRSQGRAGLWRLTQADAAAIGLTVNAALDERLDPMTSSEKAARRIADLIKSYGTPALALAAFLDEKAVLAAIASAGEKTSFFSLYLPEALEKSVYQVIAGKVLFANPASYGYRSARAWPVLAKRRVKLTAPALLAEEAEKQKLDLKTFRDMNPHILGEAAPAGAYIYLP